MKQMRKFHLLLTALNNMTVDLPAPMNLSLFWNMGSMLGVCLGIQLLSGILLTMHYSADVSLSFFYLTHITRNVNLGWLLRNLHMNGASIFFLCLYSHMARSMFFASFKLSVTWTIGVTIYIMAMATAFMGYLLPWGQMSFWGATVITNLFSTIPYVGTEVVEWLWGGFGVNNPTLTRFFTLHFLLPFVIVVLVLMHLAYLHETGSNNPLGTTSDTSKTSFHFMYTTKDMMGFMWMIMVLTILAICLPNYLGDPENFIPANPLITPTHIKPEWYFLWAYAILRSIPNKLGGVVTMFSAILILYFMPLKSQDMSNPNSMMKESFLNWVLLIVMLLLTWVGGCPVEEPYDGLGLSLTNWYFTIMFTLLSM